METVATASFWFAVPRSDQLFQLREPRRLYDFPLVSDHDIARRECRPQELPDPGPEGRSVDRAVQHQRRTIRSLRNPARNVVVVQWPCGTEATSRSPRRARPRVRVMLVLVQVSSRKIRRVGSRPGCASRQRRRASAMSARACSATWRVFFECQAQTDQCGPHQTHADRNAVCLTQPGAEFIEGGIAM